MSHHQHDYRLMNSIASILGTYRCSCGAMVEVWWLQGLDSVPRLWVEPLQITRV